MKTYNITTRRNNGVIYNRVSFVKNGVRILDISWNPMDKHAESQAIKSADLTVIRHGLKYKTRKLKAV